MALHHQLPLFQLIFPLHGLPELLNIIPDVFDHLIECIGHNPHLVHALDRDLSDVKIASGHFACRPCQPVQRPCNAPGAYHDQTDIAQKNQKQYGDTDKLHVAQGAEKHLIISGVVFKLGIVQAVDKGVNLFVQNG